MASLTKSDNSRRGLPDRRDVDRQAPDDGAFFSRAASMSLGDAARLPGFETPVQVV